MLKKCLSMVVMGTFLISFVSADLKLAFSQEQFATVVISTVPGGANISIDGIFSGTSPIKGKRISIGKHTVRVELEGYFPWQGEIEIVEGENVIDIPALTQKEESVEIEKAGKPWYAKPLVWGLGLVIIGAAILLATSNGGGNGNGNGNGVPTPLPEPPEPPGD